jgi:ribosomal protein L11 methyltransferase
MARPLKTSGVSQISVVTTLEAEEPVAALLENLFQTTPSIYSNLEKHHSVVTAYVRAAPAVLREREERVRSGLRDLTDIGLNIGSGEILIQRVRREDWSESWKKYFKTIEIGSALLIKPSWSKQKPRKGQAVVVLDPGLSFGTGQHATTSFCLKQIVRARNRAAAKKTLSFLDIGSGSGILSIAAAKLGYAPVAGFDFDPVAVRVAQKNCRSNRVQQRVEITRKDLTRLPLGTRQRCDVICANLISTLLLSERERILNRLAPGGLLVLAGILATEFAEVQEAYEAAGLRMVQTATEREWQSGAFELS